MPHISLKYARRVLRQAFFDHSHLGFLDANTFILSQDCRISWLTIINDIP